MYIDTLVAVCILQGATLKEHQKLCTWFSDALKYCTGGLEV